MLALKWQQIGNRKSAGQNNICNRMAEKQETNMFESIFGFAEFE